MQKYLGNEEVFNSHFAPHFYIRAAHVKELHWPNPGRQVSAMGKGYTLKSARARLYGETAERLSIQSANQKTHWPLLFQSSQEPSYLDQKTVFGDHIPASHGCAAHNQINTAAFAAISELWERSLVDAWWRGLYPLKKISSEQAQSWGLTQWTIHARRGAIERRKTEFYIIDGPCPIQVCAAISFDVHRYNMAIAFSAGTDLLQTLNRAFEELLSVEMEVSNLQGVQADEIPIAEGSDCAMAVARQEELANLFASTSTFEFWSHTAPMASIKTIEDFLRISDVLDAKILISDLTNKNIGIPVCRAMFQQPERNQLFTDTSRAQPI